MPRKSFAELIKLPSRKLTAKEREDALINAESALGRTLFGSVPEGHKREFFHHQKNIWIWHENDITIRYEVRSDGVYKRIVGEKYHKILGQELENFRKATKTYLNLIKTSLYN